MTQPAGPMITPSDNPASPKSPIPPELTPITTISDQPRTPTMSSVSSTPRSPSSMSSSPPEPGYTYMRAEGSYRFSCLKCHYLTYRHDKILEHMIAHRGDLICYICGKAFIKVFTVILAVSLFQVNRSLYYLLSPDPERVRGDIGDAQLVSRTVRCATR